MKRKIRKAGVALATMGALVIGGGFVSAAENIVGETSPGENEATGDVTVTYTVASYRALYFDSQEVAFGTVRQGTTAGKVGPTLYYATTWADDVIQAKLNAEPGNNVDVLAWTGTANPPLNNQDCAEGGEGTGTVEGSAKILNASTYVALVTGIENCGMVAMEESPSLLPDLTSETWAYVATNFIVDATDFADLTDPLNENLTVTFSIDGAPANP